MLFSSMMTSFDGPLLKGADTFAAMRVGQSGLKGWCMKSTGLDANSAFRLFCGSSFTFFLAHAVHFMSVLPFWGHMCVSCVSHRKVGRVAREGTLGPYGLPFDSCSIGVVVGRCGG